MQLNNEEISRYSRHLRLPEVGMEGQIKLKESKVLLVGAGGLGCPIGMYLGAAGIGTMGLIDFDVVDTSNLQRQIAYTVEDIGKPKVEQLARTITAANPNVKIVTYNEGVTNDNAIELFSQYDLIVDGSDNFNTRYLVSDATYLAKKPLIYGSIFRFQGQMTVFDPHHEGPCYRCLYASPPPAALVPNCAEGGVLGVLPGIVGLIQATEVIKFLLGKGKSLVGRLLLFDALKMSFKDIKIRKDPHCALCGENATITELQDYEAFCSVLLPQEKSDFNEDEHTIYAPELEEIMESGEPFSLIDVREPHEWEICHLEGATLIPLVDLKNAIPGLNKEAPIYIYCYKGIRSMRAVRELVTSGFTNVKSLDGGIDRWSEVVDPSIPRY
ncbi:molybdopterin-synthase adenylyltransferase MoeB [Deltaproteobacteria bacterium TL4]